MASERSYEASGIRSSQNTPIKHFAELEREEGRGSQLSRSVRYSDSLEDTPARIVLYGAGYDRGSIRGGQASEGISWQAWGDNYRRRSDGQREAVHGRGAAAPVLVA